ncbi:magnesium chelatase accessory protein [Palleronia aestuarii]|uniref:Magnesium chelatase accessory protein n=1 Tax=Palleronia aestuarii TaxID=568105 RepID=A0A2W7P682_9RHOB|nr:alpha/beta fold hydrolase BchO [Palleronia aestuarii]PZX18912.1 magnesium chelatase accessory protein [Palleronia aestuarii]
MEWDKDGRDWPNRDASRFVESRPHRWHVQVAGEGPTLLLLHGTGGATHSWRDLLPHLAERFEVVALDLPGHGFTRRGTRHRSGLAPMAADIWTLCDAQGWRPDAIVGHSAGGALAVEMAASRDGRALGAVIGLNAALGGFEGAAGLVFPAMAKALASLRVVPRLVARLPGGERRIEAMLDATGSRIDARGRALYARLLSDPEHIDGALAMMAAWTTRGLPTKLASLDIPVTLMAGTNDRTVPSRVSEAAAARARHGEFLDLGPLGHLAHEERPDLVADEIGARIRI